MRRRVLWEDEPATRELCKVRGGQLDLVGVRVRVRVGARVRVTLLEHALHLAQLRDVVPLDVRVLLVIVSRGVRVRARGSARFRELPNPVPATLAPGVSPGSCRAAGRVPAHAAPSWPLGPPGSPP